MEGSMHHEVLLALSGYPGNTFRSSKDNDTIEVDPTLPYIHPSEVSLLNRICKLGSHYNRLKRFIDDQNAATFCLPPVLSPPTHTRSGLYLKALSCGIDKLLTNYRGALINMEQKCMSEPHLPLSHLQSELEEFQLLLPALESCVNHVMSGRSQGCQILSYLYDQCSSGVPIIKTSFERILCVCHGVLYKQLSSWMLHGLLDTRGEFFIEVQQKKEKGVEVERCSVAGALDKSSQSGSEQTRFTINHFLAPSYLPVRVLEKILFVGVAVTIFQIQTSTSKERNSGTLFPTGAGSKFQSDQFHFGHMLAQLQREVLFQLHEFEKVVDSIRDCVAELLWKLLVEESNLAGHLKVMKDFFLLGRGELFLAFIDLSHHFMHFPPSATTQHDVSTSFQQAMIRVGMNSEQFSKEFQLTVPYTKQRGVVTQPPESGVSSWDQLTLSHSMEWPLPILFTPVILSKYNTLFQMLLTIRRTQLGLQHSWALLMHHRKRLEELRQVWELRTHMGFLIDNLQYYVQVDVLETQFSELLEKVSTTHDYESIKHAHERYLTTLQSQLFFTQPQIHHCLLEILNLCNTFSSLLQLSDELSLTSKERTEVNRISKDFGRQASLFFDIVSGVKGHGSAPHLAQLLLRVDYNKYFSTIKRVTSLTTTTASMLS